ncbi:hypothetical protein MHU86_1174 [Fragilaria crotonensis]|nr:hypothetical protein MHU86_1174 [Fragilaria crotonensis]
MKLSLLSLILLCLPAALAFTLAPQQRLKQSSSVSQLEAVKFDKKQDKWVTNKPEIEGPEAGYDIWGTVIRGGPTPFFTRLTNPDTYEQAVLKFMATDKVDRITAQANMDNYLSNPNDWTYYRIQGLDPDYVTVDTKELTLRIVWSGVVVALGGRAIYSLVTGEPFNLH